MIDYQEKLFEAIKRKTPSNQDWRVVCTNVLEVSRSGFYRRLSGDTPLSFKEAISLAEFFNISIDQILTSHDSVVPFSFDKIYSDKFSFENYLGALLKDLTLLSQIPGSKVFYATRELPIFHYMLSPEVFYFKMFAWTDSMQGPQNLKNRLFSLSDYSKDAWLKQLIIKSIATFYQLDCTEIWARGILDNTLSQIEFYAESMRFAKKEDALLICNGLRKIIIDLHEMAMEGGRKYPGIGTEAKFHLYQNEIVHTNNTVLVSTPAMSAVYATFDNPNFLKTTKQDFCDYTKGWFDNLIDSSTPVSATNSRAREKLFNELERRIEVTESIVTQVKEKSPET